MHLVDQWEMEMQLVDDQREMELTDLRELQFLDLRKPQALQLDHLGWEQHQPLQAALVDLYQYVVVAKQQQQQS
jgi:hypothetical protein